MEEFTDSIPKLCSTT